MEEKNTIEDVDKMSKEERSGKLDPSAVEVFRTTDAQIQKTRLTQCNFKMHMWRKISDNEVACTKCPTVLIITPEHMTTLFPKT